MELITSESWSDDEPRAKYRVGDKIVYVVRNPSKSAPMGHEIEMMKLASSVGVPCPRVYSYSHVEGLEVSVMEYVDGRPLAEEPDNPRARELLSQALDAMALVRSVEMRVTTQVLFPGGAVYPSSRELYAYWVRHVVVLREVFNVEGPEVDEPWLTSMLPQEDCVLSHGDMSDDNVIVTPTGICLIDWECAGFVPESIVRAQAGRLDLSTTKGQVLDCLYRNVRHSVVREIPEFQAQLVRLESIRLESVGRETRPEPGASAP